MFSFDKNKYIVLLQKVFPLALLALLTMLGVVSFFRGEKPYFRDFENRAETSFPEWSKEDWLDGKYQDELKAAVTDYQPYIFNAKQTYFYIRNSLLLSFQKSHYNFSDYYVHFIKNINLVGDTVNQYLLYPNLKMNTDQEWTAQYIIHRFDEVARNNPRTEFYLYYVTTDKDFHFDKNYRESNYDKIRSWLTLPEGHVSCLELKDFEQYKRFFYKTDHHWQCFGSYQGYKDVFQMLRLAEQGETLMCPKEPDSTMVGVPDDDPPAVTDGARAVLVSRYMHGSKSRATGTRGQFFGKVYVYNFDYVPMSITKDGEPFQYGNPELYLSNQDFDREYNIWYGAVFGGDTGELIFDTGRTDRPDILVIGDSFDNAVLKLLAGHYNRLYSVDLRHYERQKNEPFNIDNYIKDHQINTVLFFANVTLYVSETFMHF